MARAEFTTIDLLILGAVDICGKLCGNLHHLSLSAFSPLPIIIIGVTQNCAADIQNVLSTWDFPEHAGLFRALPDDGLASGFDDS